MGVEARSGTTLSQGRAIRPESQPMKYAVLRKPEQRALGELVETLRLAVDARAGGESRSFECGGARSAPNRRKGDVQHARRGKMAMNVLVTGSRGSGKSTVLLSARRALEDPSWFFSDADRSVAPDEAEQMRLRSELENLRPHLLWLPVLDMQNMREGANLLAHLLVRVREALEPAGTLTGSERDRDVRSDAPPSILEEGSQPCWDDIESLVRRATLLWEGATEEESRKRVDVQIKAAEDFAHFSEAFQKAVDGVIRFLTRRHSLASPLMLVLPIDNGDRSAAHAAQLLKLTRLVYSPNLLYVLAAGEKELGIFLQRSHREEVAGDVKAVSSADNEETVAIARQQSAAARREMLPPAQRVTVHCVTVQEALEYRGEGLVIDERSPKTLRDLLECLPIAYGTEQQVRPKNLLHLMFLNDYLDDEARRCLRRARPPKGTAPSRPRDEQVEFFTIAAQNALALPIRNLLDLWSLAYREHLRIESLVDKAREGEEERVGHDGERAMLVQRSESAIRVVKEMLRRAVEESELPDWACRLLLTRVIPEEAGDNCIVDLRGSPLRWLQQFSVHSTIDATSAPTTNGNPARGTILRSKVVLHDFLGFKLELNDPATNQRTELPSAVSGWLMLLYDLLNAHPEVRVVIDVSTTMGQNPLLMETQHLAMLDDEDHELIDVRFGWPLPQFDSFFEYELLTAQWDALVEYVLPRGDPALSAERKMRPEHLLRLLVSAWIDNVCSVAITIGNPAAPAHGWDWHDLEALYAPEAVFETSLDTYEKNVLVRLKSVYDQIRKGSEQWPRVREIVSWLETRLPLLLEPEYLASARVSRLLDQLGDLEMRSQQARGLHKTWIEQSKSLQWERVRLLNEAIRRAYERRDQQAQATLSDAARETRPRDKRRRQIRESCAKWFAAMADFGEAGEEALFPPRLSPVDGNSGNGANANRR